MTKRFENRLDKSNIKFNTLNPVWDNEKETGLNVFEMIDLLNKYDAEYNMCHNDVLRLEKENELLKIDKQQLHMAMSRENVRHKQFKDKVFDLIDKKIEEYKKYDGYDTESYYIGTGLLKDLKEELLDD